MGNKQISPNSVLSQFNILKTQKCYPYHLLQHKRTHHILLAKQLTTITAISSQTIQHLLTNKMNNKSSFVTQVTYWQKTENNIYCGQFYNKIIVLFNDYGVRMRLKQYIEMKIRNNKKINNQLISIPQAYTIIQSVLKGFRYYNNIQHSHTSININCILFDGQSLVLLDPWLSQNSDINNQANNQKKSNYKSHLFYKSPQRQLYQKDQIQSFDQIKSLLYQFGLLMIDLISNYKYTSLKNQINFGENNQISKYQRSNIGLLLQEIEDFKLRSHLNILLNPNPQKRQLIFSILLPQKVTLKQFNNIKPMNYNNLVNRRFTTQLTQSNMQRKLKSLKKPQNCNKFFNQNTSLTYNHHYLSQQSSPLSQSMQKKALKKNIITSQSNFSYVQMLRTPTQSNYFPSKKHSPVIQLEHQKHRTSISNWPFPHKIIDINTNNNNNQLLNKNTKKFQTVQMSRSTKNHQNPQILFRKQSLNKYPKNKLIAKSMARISQLKNQNYISSKVGSMHKTQDQLKNFHNKQQILLPGTPRQNSSNKKLAYNKLSSNKSTKLSPPTPQFKINKLLLFDDSVSNIKYIQNFNDQDVGYKKKTYESVEQQQLLSKQQEQTQYILVTDSVTTLPKQIQYKSLNLFQQPIKTKEQKYPKTNLNLKPSQIQGKETHSIILNNQIRQKEIQKQTINKRNEQYFSSINKNIQNINSVGITNHKQAVHIKNNSIKIIPHKIQPSTIKLSHLPSIYTQPCKFVTSINDQIIQNNQLFPNIADQNNISNYLHLSSKNKNKEDIKKQSKNSMQQSQASFSYNLLKQFDKQICMQNRKQSQNIISIIPTIHINNVDYLKAPVPYSDQTLLNKLILTNNNLPESSFFISNRDQRISIDNLTNLQQNKKNIYYVIEEYPGYGKYLTETNNQTKQRYQGYKCSNMKEGHGTYYFANGFVYQGEWKNDLQNGQGCLYKKRDSQKNVQIKSSFFNQSDVFQIIIKGIWNNGQLVQTLDNKNKNYTTSKVKKYIKDQYRTSLSSLLLKQQIFVPINSHKSFKQNTIPPIQTKIYNQSFQTKIRTEQKFNNIKQKNKIYQIQKNNKLEQIIRISDEKNIDMIKFLNGDIFKGKIQVNKSLEESQGLLEGIVYKINGGQIRPKSIIKNNILNPTN